MPTIFDWHYNDISSLLEDFKDRAYEERNARQWATLMRITLRVYKAHVKSGYFNLVVKFHK